MDRLTCEECRGLAEENGGECDCANCPDKPVQGLHVRSAEAWEMWRRLDACGRSVDTFSGCPLSLRIEAVKQECAESDDPDYVRRLVLLIEEEVMRRRMKRFNDNQKSK